MYCEHQLCFDCVVFPDLGIEINLDSIPLDKNSTYIYIKH